MGQLTFAKFRFNRTPAVLYPVFTVSGIRKCLIWSRRRGQFQSCLAGFGWFVSLHRTRQRADTYWDRSSIHTQLGSLTSAGSAFYSCLHTRDGPIQGDARCSPLLRICPGLNNRLLRSSRILQLYVMLQYRPSNHFDAPYWTTNSGAPVWNNNNSLTVGSRGMSFI